MDVANHLLIVIFTNKMKKQCIIYYLMNVLFSYILLSLSLMYHLLTIPTWIIKVRAHLLQEIIQNDFSTNIQRTFLITIFILWTERCNWIFRNESLCIINLMFQILNGMYGMYFFFFTSFVVLAQYLLSSFLSQIGIFFVLLLYHNIYAIS